MWQACSTDHQRQGKQNHVQFVVDIGGVLIEAEVGDNLVQLAEDRHAGIHVSREQTQTWNRVTGQLQRDEHSRNGVGNDQHAVLCHLGVGDTLHATHNCVDEDHDSRDHEANGGINFQEAGEGNTSTSHLADNVGNRRYDQADNRYEAGILAVETVADKLGNRKLAKLPQVRSQQHGQQNVTASPAHKEGGVGVATGSNQTCHGDKRCRGHPVGADCCAVGDRMNTAAGNVEVTRASGLGPDSNCDVEEE